MNQGCRISTTNALLHSGVFLMSAVALCLCSIAYAEDSKVAAKTPELMPAAQENAIVKKYCGGCHSDVLMYGGLSVEHFDAVHPEPSVAAMLLSKITNGHTPKDIDAAAQGSDPAAKILELMRNSAMGAAGNGVPDGPTQVAFGKTLAAQAAGAHEWNWVISTSANNSRTVTASILREVPSRKKAGITDSFRLIVSCKIAPNELEITEGEMKLAWANGTPEEGQPFTVEIDGKLFSAYRADGGRKQGNGTYGPGSSVLYHYGSNSGAMPVAVGRSLPFPSRTVAISDVFPQETAIFPFDNMSEQLRHELMACFPRYDVVY